MCGRFAAINLENKTPYAKMVEELLAGQVAPGSKLKLSGDVFPEDRVPVFIDDGKLKATLMTWGFRGFPNPKRPQAKPRPIINTRCETSLDLPTWRESMQKRRCLVPSSGFYEWKRKPGSKVAEKCLFYLDGEKELFLAAIYKEFIVNDEKTFLFSIMTTSANSSVMDVHERMPVIVLPSEFSSWFSPGFSSLFARDGIVLSKRPCG
jgi:putative SOS response-associated peptidase YedK